MRKWNQMKKRAMAFTLCAIMLFNSNVTVFAEGEESSVINQESSLVIEESSEVIEESSEVIEEASDIVEESSEVIEESSEIIEESSEAIEESSAIIEESSEINEESSAIIEEPSEINEESSEVIEESSVAIEENSEMTENIQNTSIQANAQAGADLVEKSTEKKVPDATKEIKKEIVGTIELTTEIDGITITLSGLTTSFEEGKEYTLSVAKIENKDDAVNETYEVIEDEQIIAAVEEAMDQIAEEKEKVVTNYQAFDIKLMADGKEVQPLGPVEVKFSGKEVEESVKDEETETNVIHVDAATNKVEDMEAEVTEEKDVTIETTHFSIYVYVELKEAEEITLNVEHWLGADAIEPVRNSIKLPHGFKGTVEELLEICISEEAESSYLLTKVSVDGNEKADGSIVVIDKDTTLKLEYKLIADTKPDSFFDSYAETKWEEINKNKTADGLDENDKSNVTLTVGGDSANKGSDIVFVIDKSSCHAFAQDKLVHMFNSLVEAQGKSGATIKVAVVIFNFTEHVEIPLTVLTSDNAAELSEIVKNSGYSGGTNMESGLRKAKEILDADTDVPAANKHVILVSDGYTWIYDNNDIPHTILYGTGSAGTQGHVNVRGSYYKVPSNKTWDDYWATIQYYVEKDWRDKEARIGMFDYDVSCYGVNKGPYTTAEDLATIPEKPSEHATNMERAMYDAWEAYTALEAAGYSCYSNNLNETKTSTGHNFMNMLANGKAVDFDAIRDSIIYSISKGTTVTDYIGYDPDEDEGYDFDFVQEVDTLELNVGNMTYEAAEVSGAEGVTKTYEFTAQDATEATFKLEYYYGNGTTTERFVWTFGEDVSAFAPVSLRYQVYLKGKSERPGTHIAYTNRYAVINPKDSDGNSGEPEYFPVPEVEYEVPLWIRIIKEAATQEGSRVQGAEFALYNMDGTQIDLDLTAQGVNGITTNENGVAEFVIEPGSYTLKEVKAPDGYALTNQEYTIVYSENGVLINDEAVDTQIKTEEGTVGGIIEVTFTDHPVYELPSAGGSGIYLYTISGAVLMAGAVLVLYKNKRKEVL